MAGKTVDWGSLPEKMVRCRAMHEVVADAQRRMTVREKPLSRWLGDKMQSLWYRIDDRANGCGCLSRIAAFIQREVGRRICERYGHTFRRVTFHDTTVCPRCGLEEPRNRR